MSTTTKLQRIINSNKPYLKNQPLDFSNLEPAVEAANMVLQTIIGPPFKWPWNRNTFSFPTNPATGDYQIAVPDFGFLETQWVTDETGKVHALNGAVSLPMPTSSTVSRPTQVSLQKDDNQGNLTFRVDKMPNAVYTISGDYQCRAPLISSPASLLRPLPDHMRYIFDWGFLALMGQLVNDVRVDWWEKKFAGRLLALQDGLDQQSINIFLGIWETNMKSMARAQASVQTGNLGRQV